ncbi:MAG TPA: HAD family hydrolase [Candidatus Nanopelagicaceae bacterium]|nr:HAD family hydrolase [Candidatus Nanopelagicaceae bacterium]
MDSIYFNVRKIMGHLKAILFDLDGTLIDVDLNQFIPGYLKLLANSVAHLISPKKMVPAILKASVFVNSNDGKIPNEEVFSNAFFPVEGYEKEEIQPLFTKFYEEGFKELKKFTKKKPEARKVIQTAFNKGYKVVIATTPILPLTAIEQRLDWAGVGDFPYDLITSIENSCATKPNLLYFQLIFKYLKLSAKECIMVGDEDKDMVCSKLGSQTFLVNSSNINLSDETPEPTYKGNLIDLIELL